MQAATIRRPRAQLAVIAFVTAAALALASACSGSGHAPAHPAAVRIPNPEALVGEYYRLLNAENLNGILALMVSDPVLSEPFSNEHALTVHTGYASVSHFYAYGFRTRDDQVVTEYIRAQSPGTVDAGWSLHGSDGLGVSGVTHFRIQDGQIARLDIELRD